MKISHNGYVLYKRECGRCGRNFLTTAKTGRICNDCNRSRNKVRHEITLEEVEKWKRKKHKRKSKYH